MSYYIYDIHTTNLFGLSASLLPHKWAIKAGLLVKISIFMQVLWLKHFKLQLIVRRHFTGPHQQVTFQETVAFSTDEEAWIYLMIWH